MFPVRLIGFGILALLSASCASSTEGAASAPLSASSAIQEQELADVSHLNAYDAIRRLRPNWLRVRGVGTFARQQSAGIRLYVDGARRNDLDNLRNIRASNIQEIRYLDSRRATTRFGTDHGDGAILVITKGS